MHVVVKHAVTSHKYWPGIIILLWHESLTTPVRRRLVFRVLRGRRPVLLHYYSMLCRRCHDRSNISINGRR